MRAILWIYRVKWNVAKRSITPIFCPGVLREQVMMMTMWLGTMKSFIEILIFGGQDWRFWC